MILISACLCGVNCKYNGKSNYNKAIEDLVKLRKAIILCPEQLGGLTTPRRCCEIKDGSGEDVLHGRGKVINNLGEDITENFTRGAEEALRIAKLYNVEYAILKKKSPSCGYGEIYNGNFTGEVISGNGVTAELLSENNIKVFNEDNYKPELFMKLDYAF
ncbi:MAG: DUF523 domain-containing protein [Clostridium sp.]